MTIPDSPRERDLYFSTTGRLAVAPEELFRRASGFSLLLGQGHVPMDSNPLIERESAQENARIMHVARACAAGPAQPGSTPVGAMTGAEAFGS